MPSRVENAAEAFHSRLGGDVIGTVPCVTADPGQVGHIQDLFYSHLMIGWQFMPFSFSLHDFCMVCNSMGNHSIWYERKEAIATWSYSSSISVDTKGKPDMSMIWVRS